MPGIKEAAARIARERIEKLATTPMRKELAKKLGPKIEEIAAHPSVKRMYLFGSYASGKLDPSDIDIVVRHKKQLSYTERPPKEITDFHKRYTLKHSGEPGDLHIINTYKPQHLDVPREDKEVVRRETKEFMGGPGHYTIEDLRDAVKAITSESRGMGDLTGIRDIGRDRYGKEHKWIRLLGFAGAAGAVSGLMGSDEAEAALLTSQTRKGLYKALLEEYVAKKGGGSIRNLDKETLTTVKNDIRKIADKAFEGIKSIELKNLPYGNLGVYDSRKKSITLNKRYDMDVVLHDYGDPELAHSTLAHEIGHHLDKKGFDMTMRSYRLGDMRRFNNIKEVQELDAREFGTQVRGRASGALSKDSLKGKFKDYILGLAGALGLGATLYNDKAEAGVKDKMIGAPLKSASRAIKGELSSAWKDLAGTEFKGKTIKYITKGKGDLRYIILNDDTAYPVSKEVVHSLSKAAGTKKSLGEFSAADAEGKLSKAYKSLKYHMSRAYGDENAITDYSKRYTEQIKLSGLEPPKISLVEADGKKFTMPKDFADLLNKEGAIKKLKDLP